jgi:hypothetical protein
MEGLEHMALFATVGYATQELRRELEPHVWAEYFRSIALLRAGVLATVQVIGARLAADLTDRPRALRQIGYDSKQDTLELAVGAHSAPGAVLRYFISAPLAIDVAEAHDRTTLLVSDASGHRTQICLFNLPGHLPQRRVPAPDSPASQRRGDRR